MVSTTTATTTIITATMNFVVFQLEKLHFKIIITILIYVVVIIINIGLTIIIEVLMN